MQDIYLTILSVLLGGAIGSIAWAFKTINKLDKGLAVNQSKSVDMKESLKGASDSISYFNTRMIRLETRQETTDRDMGEIKINIKEIAESIRKGQEGQSEFNNKVLRKLDRALDGKDRREDS
jgi:predicted  nucleic acid-binding Zn-ribbon protein